MIFGQTRKNCHKPTFTYLTNNCTVQQKMSTSWKRAVPTKKTSKQTSNLFFRDKALIFTQSSYLRSNTDKLLSTLNWQYPKIDEKLIQTWLRMLGERHAIPRPKPRKRRSIYLSFTNSTNF